MWHVTCDMWHMTCDRWLMAHGEGWTFCQKKKEEEKITWYMTWQKKNTCNMWRVTCDTWYVTCDRWLMTHGEAWTFSQNCSSLAKTVLDWQGVEDI